MAPVFRVSREGRPAGVESGRGEMGVRLELVGQGCVGEVGSEELTCVAQRAPEGFKPIPI